MKKTLIFLNAPAVAVSTEAAYAFPTQPELTGLPASE